MNGIKGLLVFSVFLMAFCAGGEGFAKSRGGVSGFIDELIDTSHKMDKGKVLDPLQSIVGEELFQWIRPGVIFHISERHQLSALKGYSWVYPDTWMWFENFINRSWIMEGTQDPYLLMFMVFQDLKNAQIVGLRNNQFNLYLPESCEKKSKWHGKWIVYPGDYLLDEIGQESTSDDLEQNDYYKDYVKYKAEKTLLFFDHGENRYFGIRRVNGQWKLQSVGLDHDCDA